MHKKLLTIHTKSEETQIIIMRTCESCRSYLTGIWGSTAGNGAKSELLYSALCLERLSSPANNYFTCNYWSILSQSVEFFFHWSFYCSLELTFHCYTLFAKLYYILNFSAERFPLLLIPVVLYMFLSTVEYTVSWSVDPDYSASNVSLINNRLCIFHFTKGLQIHGHLSRWKLQNWCN